MKIKMNMNIVEDSPIYVYEEILKVKGKRFPKGYWSSEDAEDKAEIIIRYLFEYKLRYTREDIINNVDFRFFKKYKLGGVMTSLFDKSIYNVLQHLYPNEFKQWELKNVSNGYWNEERAIVAMRWLIDEKLKWSDEQIKSELCINTFRENGLITMLFTMPKSSPFVALDKAYPGKFKPWELKVTPKGFWNKDTAREAVVWLIEDKLGWNYEDVLARFSLKVLLDNGLNGLVSNMFGNSCFSILENAYPGMYDPNDFKTRRRKLKY